MAAPYGAISRQYGGRIARAVDDVEAMRRSGHASQVRRPVPQQASAVAFMLKTDLEPGGDSPGSASAWLITFEDGKPKLPEDTGQTVKVWDIAGTRRAYGKDHWSEGGELTGAIGWARQILPADQFEDGYAIVDLPPLAARCWATLADDLASTDATADVKELSRIGEGQEPFAEEATATADNPLGWSGSEDDTCIVERDADGTWFVAAVAGKTIEVTVETALQVSGTNLQKKTRTITVLKAGEESAWATWHAGTNCP